MNADQAHPDPERMWRHRRWMAWTCLVSILVVDGLAAAGYVETKAEPLLQTGTWAKWAVIFAYIANCATDKLAETWYRR